MGDLRYVYAVCRPFDAPLQAELSGVAGGPPRQLVHRDLVAVVGAVPEGDFGGSALSAHLTDADWFAATVGAHRRVVAALTTVTSPLPLRPATVLRDDSAVRSMVEARCVDFRSTLRRLHGRVEWTLRVYAGDGSAEIGGSGAARQLHGRLTGLAGEARLRRPCPQQPQHTRRAGPDVVTGAPVPEPVLEAAYLVDRSRVQEFVAEAESAQGAQEGLRIALDGPRAAYSFTGMHPEPADP